MIVKARVDSSLILYEHCVACDNDMCFWTRRGVVSAGLNAAPYELLPCNITSNLTPFWYYPLQPTNQAPTPKSAQLDFGPSGTRNRLQQEWQRPRTFSLLEICSNLVKSG